VAVPALVKSAAVSVEGLMASENANVKFIGTEFVLANWLPDLANEDTAGGVESWV
jgi:hypothetical protein